MNAFTLLKALSLYPSLSLPRSLARALSLSLSFSLMLVLSLSLSLACALTLSLTASSFCLSDSSQSGGGGALGWLGRAYLEEPRTFTTKPCLAAPAGSPARPGEICVSVSLSAIACSLFLLLSLGKQHMEPTHVLDIRKTKKTPYHCFISYSFVCISNA